MFFFFQNSWWTLITKKKQIILKSEVHTREKEAVHSKKNTKLPLKQRIRFPAQWGTKTEGFT